MLPFELKREQNLKILADFTEQHPEMKEFIDLMMRFDSWKEDDEKPEGRIRIVVGKQLKSKFHVYLSTYLAKPKIYLNSYGTSPSLTFRDDRGDHADNGCSINLR